MLFNPLHVLTFDVPSCTAFKPDANPHENLHQVYVVLQNGFLAQPVNDGLSLLGIEIIEFEELNVLLRSLLKLGLFQSFQ